MFNYAGWRNACNCIFIGFAAVFIVTRLIIFPFRYPHTPFTLIFTVALNLCILWCRIIYCTWVYPVTIYEPFFGYYFFNGLLMVLQCLHIFWAVLIIRIAVRFLTSNVRNRILTLNHHPSSLNIYQSAFFFFLRKRLTMREVTKMRRMNQKTRRTTKRIKSTWRKTGRCRMATQFTTIITTRRSERQERIKEGLISLSQGGEERDGQTGGVGGVTIPPNPERQVSWRCSTLLLSWHRNALTHIGRFLVRAQRSKRTVSATIRDMAAVALSSEKRNTSSHSGGRRERCVDRRETMLLLRELSLLRALEPCQRRLAKYQLQLPA